MESKALFSKTPPVKLFFIAAFPGAVSMLASALYQMMDVVCSSADFWEKAPFAALNLAMPFVIINFALADLIGVGSSVPISVSLGRKKEQEANNIFTCAMPDDLYCRHCNGHYPVCGGTVSDARQWARGGDFG